MVARFMLSSKINKEKVNFKNIQLELLAEDNTTLIEHEVLESGLEKDGATFFFKIKPKSVMKLQNGSIRLKFLSSQEICSDTNNQNYLIQTEAELKPVGYYISASDAGVQSVTQSTSTALSVVMILSFVLSASLAFILIKIFNMIDFLVLINVKHPSNLSAVFKILGTSMFDDLPNVFEFLTDETCHIGRIKFVEQDFSCQIFKNMGNYILFILAMCGLKLVILGLQFATRGDSTNRIKQREITPENQNSE